MTISAGGYLVVAKDSAIMRQYFGIIADDWGSSSLSNSGRMIYLYDADENIIDSVNFKNTSPWPSIGSSGGSSIELNDCFSNNNAGESWKKSTNFSGVVINEDSLFCTPGAANEPFLPAARFYSDSRIIHENENVRFTNISIGNNLTYEWLFDGGTPASSQVENPNVSYSSCGLFDVSLTIANGTITDNSTKEDYIAVLPTGCAITETFPYSQTFETFPECWIAQPAAGEGAWLIDNTVGYEDNNSIKFPCSNYSNDAEGILITQQINITALNTPSIVFYYNGSANSNNTPPQIKITEYSAEFNIIEQNSISGYTNNWTLFSKLLNDETNFITIKITNNENNTAVYIDNFQIIDGPANSKLISGYITEDGVPIPNILVSIDTETTVTTDANGFYYVYVDNSWSGIIRPANPQYLYEPEYIEVIDISEDIGNANFEAMLLPDGWLFSQTANSHTFCILEEALNEQQFTIGSWVGLFYTNAEGDETCCGANKIRSLTNTCINAWAENPSTNDPGFIVNGNVIWKIWDKASGVLFSASVSYISGPSTYQIDGLSIINKIIISQNIHKLVIPVGWSAISTYTVPFNPSLNDIFEGMEDKIVVLLNDQGSYYPGNSNNQLENWDSEKGWLIKTTENISISFTGLITENFKVVFEEGWTLFPIKSANTVSIESLFRTEHLDIIKGYGTNEIYIPNLTESFDLIPGRAYKARFNTIDSIMFSDGDNIPSINENIISNMPIASPFGGYITPTQHDHVFIFEETSALQNGDIIGAFNTNSLCVGFFEVTNGTAVFKIYGDDESTEIADGMINGEKVSFILLRNNLLYSVNVAFAPNSPNNNHYTKDGITKINRIHLTPLSIDEYQNTDNFNVYPNPVTDLLYIDSKTDELFDFTIVSITGTKIANGKLRTNSSSIDLSNYANGIYILQLVGKTLKANYRIIKI